jgi:hypothetical protein
VCYAIALVWMLAVAAPSALRKERVPDFAQYYMGGAMVLAGEPQALYPVPRPESTRNAGFVDASDMRPAYAAVAREQGIAGYNRFVYPPPVAILFAPFAELPYGRALALWVVLMCFAGWGVALVAAGVHARLAAEPSRLSGAIALAVAGSPLMLHAIRSGNLSPAIALFLGLAVLGLMDRSSRWTGAWLALGGLFKGTSAVLLPLAIARRRWRALGIVAASALLVVAASVALLGLGPFRTFILEIAPTHARSEGSSASQSLSALLLRATGRTALPESWSSAVAALHLIAFLTLAALVLAKRKRLETSPGTVAAAAAALLACPLAFSPLVWAHYHLIGFLTLGWLVEEARRSPARAVLAAIPALSLLLPLCLLVRIQVPLPEPIRSHLLLAALLTIALGAARLLSREAPREPA